MRRDWTALLCTEPWPLQPVKCLSSQLACVTLRALRWQRVKWYLNYFRIQILQNPQPLCAHICCTTFAAHSRQSAKQPMETQTRAVRKFLFKGQWKWQTLKCCFVSVLENNRIGFWSRALFYSLQSLALWSPVPWDKVELIGKGRELWRFIWFFKFFFGLQLFIYSKHHCLWLRLDLFLLMFSNLRLLLAEPDPPVALCGPTLSAGADQHTTREHLHFIICYKGTAKAFLQGHSFCSGWGALGRNLLASGLGAELC